MCTIMKIPDAMAQLDRLLERELPQHGDVERVERRMGHSKGYLRKLRNKNWNVLLVTLLEVLEGLDIPPGVFFGRLFDVQSDPESCLLAIERQSGETPVLAALEKATARLARSEPRVAAEDVGRRARLEDLTRSSRSDQCKRLRSTQKFQALDFLQRYLDYLDRLRYEQADNAAKIAETVATGVVELVVCSPTERLELQCKALGVYGSSARLLGQFTPAARAIRLGMKLAQRHDLEVSYAELLQRGAYVLHDHGEYDRALGLLQDAQVIYSDLGLEKSLGMALVDRGIMLGQKGDYQRAQRVFRQALETLPLRPGTCCRSRLASLHGIAVAQRHLGELDAAETSLDEALAYASAQSGAVVGKLIWLQGMIASDRQEHAEAELLLLEALRLFTACDDPLDVALVSLGLMKALLAQDKGQEAVGLAKQMTALLKRFKGNQLAEGALVELIEGGLRGEVSVELVERVAANLAKGGPLPDRVRH